MTTTTASDPIRLSIAEDEADAQAYARLLTHAFAIPPADSAAFTSILGLANVRLVGRGSAARAGYALYDMSQWFGGRAVRCAGIAGVSVRPDLRGSGLGTALVRACVEDCARTGHPLATLYPASLELYRRGGFAVAGSRFELRASCSTWPRARTSLVVEPLSGVDDAAMRACYEAVARTRNGWLARCEALWKRVAEQRGEKREGWAVKRGDEVRGYVWFARRPSPSGPRTDLACSDLVALDLEAARALVGFLGSYGTVVDQVSAFVAPHDPLLDAFPERVYELKLVYPWMVRVVDARAAIAARGFGPLSLAVGLEIADDLLARNRGRFRLVVDDGVGRLEPGGDGAVALDVSALAALYSGFASASALTSSGTLRGPPRQLAKLDALFAGPAPSMPEMF